VSFLLVALGAAAGSGVRFTLAARLDHRWPTGTLVVNLAGSFLLGVLSAMALSGSMLALLGTGLCGGMTTFSSLVVQGVDRGPRLGSAYLLTTVAGSLLLCWLGFVLASR
jgi:CrcB protein